MNNIEFIPETITEPETPINRLRGQKFGLTYVNIRDIKHDDWYQALNNLKPVKKFVCGFELCPTTQTPHYHIGVWFKNEVDTTNMRYFDLFEKHPHIWKIKNVEQWEKWGRYCIKDGDCHHVGCKFNGIANLVKKICEQNTCIDAIANCANSLKEVMPIIQIYKNKNLEYDPELAEELAAMDFRPGWQADLNQRLLQPPDKRIINWIYETTGNVGKTTFSDIFEFQHQEDCIVLSSTGSMRDISDIVRNMIDGGKRMKYLFLDLPRTFEDRDSIYPILECVKNGRVTCTKFKGQVLRFKSPHVVVFANWRPKMELLSRDRWNIIEL